MAQISGMKKTPNPNPWVQSSIRQTEKNTRGADDMPEQKGSMNRENWNSEKDPREAKAAKHESRCKGRIRFRQGLVEKHQQLEFECN